MKNLKLILITLLISFIFISCDKDCDCLIIRSTSIMESPNKVIDITFKCIGGNLEYRSITPDYYNLYKFKVGDKFCGTDKDILYLAPEQ